jgi:small subunit ribosomal protein S10
MTKQWFKIRLKAFDQQALYKAALEIVMAVKKTGAEVMGPMPLPTKISRYIVNRSPHIDKKSREQFERRTYNLLLCIYPSSQTTDALMKLEVASGVNIVIKVDGVGA